VRSLAAPRFCRGEPAARDPETLPQSVRALLPSAVEHALRPLPLPVALGGAGAADPGFQSLVRGAGLLPVQAAASSGKEPEDVAIEPGIPVGTAFVTGDLDVSGMGTLTWVEGDRALAFGHPMFQSGRTDVPMVVGHVQTVVPSLASSFKLCSAGKVIGRVLEDREPAVFARLGQEAPTFPCTVRIRGTMDENYDYRVAGYWETAPMFAYYALYYSSIRWEGEGNRFTLEGRSRIKLKGREKPIELANTYTSYSVLDPSLDLVVMPMEDLLTNPFAEVEVESVDYELKVTPGFHAALIESVRPDRFEVAPGDELTLYVRLLHYRGERTSREIKVAIPETARPGSPVQVIVCDAISNRMIERGMDRGFSSPLNLDDLVRLVEDVTPNNHLTVRASVMDSGLRYEGAAMPALPPSAASILVQNAGGSQVADLVRDVKVSIETPWTIEGAQMVTLPVVEPDPHNP
jgi:hypothetical protein